MNHPAFDTMLKTVGLRLADLREKKGFHAVRDFAKQHDLPVVHYWRIEKGMANVTLKSLARILTIHQMTVPDFFCLLMEEEASSIKQ